MKRRTALPIAAALLALTACGEDPTADSSAAPDGEAPVVPVSVTGELVDPEGSGLGGATLTDEDAGVQVELEASGMTPGEHPVGLYGTGTCEADGDDLFSSAGDPVAGAGELPAMVVGEDGLGRLSTLLSGIDLGELLDEDGTAVVVQPVSGDTAPPDGVTGSLAACAEIVR